jgi:hypothetical protein
VSKDITFEKCLPILERQTPGREPRLGRGNVKQIVSGAKLVGGRLEFFVRYLDRVTSRFLLMMAALIASCRNSRFHFPSPAAGRHKG